MKGKMTVSPRQMIVNSVLLLAANFLDWMVSKIGLSLGFLEKGIAQKVSDPTLFLIWKWLWCFALVISLFAVWRKPKARWFLAQVVFLVATFLILVQVYHVIVFARGLLGQS